MSRSSGTWLSFGLGILLAAAPSAAQVATGSITGSVVDPSGNAIPGISVTLMSEATGAVRRGATEANGNFVFSAVAPGQYTLVVEGQAFRKHERKEINLTPFEVLALGPIRMAIGNLVETITVRDESAAVQTATAERSGVITAKEVENLTVLNRDFIVLVTLEPGVVTIPGSSETQGFGATARFSIGGGRIENNNLNIDGQPVENTNASSRSTFISMDSVGEVRVVLNTYQAQFGRKSNGHVQAVTKSGTREYHGAGYFYKRHETLNAADFFNNRNNIPRIPYRYTSYGFNLGGPLSIPKLTGRQGKLFFFFGNENFQEARPQTIQQVTMPTALERAGDFTDSRDVNGALIVVRDPSSGLAFPGARIPAGRITAEGQNLLKLFPLPNFTNAAISARRYNFQTQKTLSVPKHNFTPRIDYHANPKNIFSFRFNYWWENIEGPSVAGAGTPAWGLLTTSYWNISKNAILSGTHILSPSTVVEWSAAHTLWTENGYSNLRQEDLDRINRANAGVNLPQFHPENNPYNLVPQVSFGGVNAAAGITYEGRFPIFGRESTTLLNSSISHTRRQHVFKAGLHIEYWRERRGPSGNFAGTFAFGRDTNNPLDSNYAYANALLGNFASYTESTNRPNLVARNKSVEWYIQDNWKVTRRLTLDFGVRFGWSTPYYTPGRIEAGFVPWLWNPSQRVSLIEPAISGGRRMGRNPLTGEISPAATIGAIAPNSGDPLNGTVSERADLNYPNGLRYDAGPTPAPRFGFAYDPFGKGRTAIRGGVGLFHDVHEMDSFPYSFYTNPPFQSNPTIYYNNFVGYTQQGGFNFASTTGGFNPERPLARTIQGNFGIQQNIGYGTVLDVAYVTSLGRHLIERRNLNSVPFGSNFLASNRDPTTNAALPVVFQRPYLGYNEIYFYEYRGNSSYHSLQVKANRRLARTVQYGLSWTWSKAMNYTNRYNESASVLVNPKVWDYAKSMWDATHVLKFHWVWDLPRGSKLWNNAVTRKVLDGWRASTIASFQTGFPVGVAVSYAYSADISGSSTDVARTVILANPVIPKSERTFERNFNTAAFGAAGKGTPGNAPKNMLRQPGINNWDISAIKEIALGAEKLKAQFRAEFYNAFNHTQFSTMDTGARFDAAGKQVNAGFGQFTAALPARKIQLSARVSW